MITLTTAAAEHISKFSNKIYFGVKASGCSGLEYVMDKHTDEINDEIVVKDKGISIFIPNDMVDILKGTVIDYIKEGLNSKFHYDNPNVVDSCGCGTSFTVK